MITQEFSALCVMRRALRALKESFFSLQDKWRGKNVFVVLLAGQRANEVRCSLGLLPERLSFVVLLEYFSAWSTVFEQQRCPVQIPRENLRAFQPRMSV